MFSKKKKKKKGLHQTWDCCFVQFRKFRRLRGGCFRMGGGYFPFFTQNRPQKHKKHAILHTSQANGGGLEPPPAPPGYATAYAPSEENKKGIRKFSARFLAFSNKIPTVRKIVLSSSRGQGNIRGLEASRPRTWPSRPRSRTSKCVLEAKDVLEDCTSARYCSRQGRIYGGAIGPWPSPLSRQDCKIA